MSKYGLIKQLENPVKDDKTQLPKGIEYRQKTVIVEGEERLVNIPAKEVGEFDRLITEAGHKISATTFNKIMREVRGIRG